MSQDVQMFMGRFQELRRKMGGMQSQQLKDAVCRELPDGSGIQVILGRELPVDEQALAADLEMLVERELGVRMKFQVIRLIMIQDPRSRSQTYPDSLIWKLR